MLSPEYIERMTEGAEEIAEKLHTEVLKDIVNRLCRLVENSENLRLGAQSRYQIEVLQEAGYLLTDIRKDIAQATGLEEEEIQSVFEKAGITALAYDKAIYDKVGLPTPNPKYSPVLYRLLQRAYERTNGEWLNYTLSMLRGANDKFIQATDEAYWQIITGTWSSGEVLKKTILRLSQHGVMVTYPSGHTDTLETAVTRALRTAVGQTCGDITAEVAQENGVTCFLTSAHLGARPTHNLWQGQVFWVDWREFARRAQTLPFGKMTFVDAIENGEIPEATPQVKAKYREFCQATDVYSITGLCGINCRHSFSPFFDGLSTNPWEDIDLSGNDERYRLEQQQRAMERRIRKMRRDLDCLEQALSVISDEFTREPIEDEHDSLLQRLRSAMAEYQAFSTANGLPMREERIEIARKTMPVL